MSTTPGRVFRVEVDGLPADVSDFEVREALAAAVLALHRREAPDGVGLSVGTSGGTGAS